jgi:Ni/Co efflux regulator RcnB
MRKLLLAAAAATVLAPAVASAQSAHEVRNDQREVAQDQRKVNHDVARGDWNKARKDQQETREDKRETRDDWQDYRKTHRSTYHRPAYHAPRGYRYRPVVVGNSLHRVFWGSTYRINNYSTYRLPSPGYHRAYVRYGNDVVLIDTRTGRVIRVYDAFFW